MKRIFYLVILLLLQQVTAYAADANTQLRCQIPKPLVCEEGSSFLCLNTAVGSVKEDFAILKGRLNLKTSVLSELTVATQHEYTKELQTIILSKPLEENCWEIFLSEDQNFCLQEDGHFAVRAGLKEFGPYTIFVSASRLQGSPMQLTQRTSHVIAPTLTSDVVTQETSGKQARVTLDLLKGCSDVCDFIGASTGGVIVSVENKVAGVSPKTIRCETNTVQGAQGRFVVNITTEPGTNQLSLTVCNAATGFEKTRCPKMVLPAFEVGGSIAQIEILSPLPAQIGEGLFLDDLQSTPPTLTFRIPGFQEALCSDAVQVTFNLEKPQPLCADENGIFKTDLLPKKGYNTALIEANLGTEKLKESVSFGWGKSLQASEFLQKAAQVWIPKPVVNETLISSLNQYLNSPAFHTWLAQAVQGSGGSSKTSATNPISDLSYCSKGAGLGAKIKITKAPQIGKLTLSPLSFDPNQLKMNVSAEDVSLGLQLVKDENNDGVPDMDPLPLKISFKKLQLEPILEQVSVSGKSFWKLSSSYTDCEYKGGSCLKMPALLAPSQFEGNASPSGAFAVCDTSQKISEKMDEICHALNVVDRQTGGVIQKRILDAINAAYACQGTLALHNTFQEGVFVHRMTDFFSFDGHVGIDSLKILPTGLMVSLKTRFGNPKSLKKGNAILVPKQSPDYLVISPEKGGISMGLSFAVFGQLLFGLQGTQQEHFSLTLDDAFYKKLGIDFEKACVTKESKKPNALCNIPPRAREILGAPISDFGYLEPTAPLKLVLIPSLAYPLRIDVLDEKGKIQIEFADWELAIESERERLIVAKLSLKLAATFSPLAVLPEDPENFYIMVRLLPLDSRWWITEKRGTNATIIPSGSLLTTLDNKLQLAVGGFDEPGEEIKIKIPRAVRLPLTEFELPKLVWGPEGFDFAWDPHTDRLLLQLLPALLN